MRWVTPSSVVEVSIGEVATVSEAIWLATPPPSYSRKIGSRFAPVVTVRASRSVTGPVMVFSCGRMIPASGSARATAPTRPRWTCPSWVCSYTYSAGLSSRRRTAPAVHSRRAFAARR